MNDGFGTARARRRDQVFVPGSAAAPSPVVLDRLVALAASLFEASAAGLAIVEGDRLKVKAAQGFDGTRLDWPLLAALADSVPRLVPDVSIDHSLGNHPLLLSLPQARFVATSPLLTVGGTLAGVLFVLDGSPRHVPSPDGMGQLEALAAIAGDVVASRHAVDAAQADSEARSRLLADVSHEMRAPLNGIMGFAKLLKHVDALDDEARRTVERIEEAGQGLLNIVNDALDISRLDSGMVRLDERPFWPARLVEDCVAMVRAEAERKELALSVESSQTSTLLVRGDPDRLRQVLLNLLSNAVKFTGSGAVKASLAVIDDDSRLRAVTLRFAVEDSGMGIAHHDIQRLFTRFVQADPSVGNRFGGSGLGLAISKSLVEAMGGAIDVDSSQGLGTRFSVTLTLPRVLDLPPEAPRRQAPDPDELRGMAILLAEDAPLNQKLVTQMLAPLGASVDVVGDGTEALEAIARRDYALVLMDMEMPVLGGLDATRRIRALPGAAGTVPIVALTANVFPEQIDLCRAAGMDDVLTKPFGPEDLAAVALRWSRRSGPVE